MKKIALLGLVLSLGSVIKADPMDDSCAACTISLALNESKAQDPQISPTTHREKIREISREELKKKISDPQFHGLVVNVLGKRFYDDAHIPRSISAPLKNLEEICKSWNKDGEIIVYCACIECDASYKAYKMLVSMGFTNVSAYEGGIREWYQAYGEKGTEGPCLRSYLKEKGESKRFLAMKDCALKRLLLDVYWGVIS